MRLGRLAQCRRCLGQLATASPADTGFLRELRELEKQTAIECGHWEQHVVPAGQGEEVVVMVLRNVPPLSLDEQPRIIRCESAERPSGVAKVLEGRVRVGT